MDRIISLNEALARADEQVDILVRNCQTGRDRLQTLAFLWVRNARQRDMHQGTAHVGAIMTLDDPPLGATDLAHAVDQIAQLALGQNQGLEIVGIDLRAGYRTEDLTKPGHDPLLR